MRTILTVLVLCCCFTGYSNTKNTYSKLCEVNKCWTEQKDINVSLLPGYTTMGEREWIRTHLSLVEQILLSRSTEHLTASKKQNRTRCLQYLHEYWQAGNFPINDDYSYRTPIFIDKYDNFCAVGYLVKASGNEQVSRMIASKTNLAYVKEMKYQELNAWANENGFTVDELAWIQPGYPPKEQAKGMGGVGGVVNELYADETEGKLYIAGEFGIVDEDIVAGNIAYVTHANDYFTWHTMGSGVVGKINAVTKYNNKIYVAGIITEAGGVPVTNVAVWDGNTWSAAGCTYGEIKDLIVYNGELYACGRFDVCASISESNFAKWDGANWQQYPGLTGTVNTMEVWNNDIVLGGDFTHNGTQTNVIKWNAKDYFREFSNTLDATVNDFEVHKGKLYAATSWIATDTVYRIKSLDGHTWNNDSSIAFFENASVYTLSSQPKGNLMAGGLFDKTSAMMTFVDNCVSIDGGEWFVVDSTINKMIVFKDKLIAGGAFKYGNGGNTELLGTAYADAEPNSIKDLPIKANVSLYPNPANGKLHVNGMKQFSYNISNITGQQVQNGKAKDAINVSTLPPGNYILRLQDSDASSVLKFTKQ